MVKSREKNIIEEEIRRRDAILEIMAIAAQRFLINPNLEANITATLRQLGTAMQVNRVYIFENHSGQRDAVEGSREHAEPILFVTATQEHQESSPASPFPRTCHDPTSRDDPLLLMSQRYEWVDEKTTPQLDNPLLQNLPYRQAGFGRWQRILSEGKPVYGNIETFPISEQVILLPQNICSIAVVPIFVGAHWWGFIGFDDCEGPRDWSTTELDTLRVAAGIIGAAIQRDAFINSIRASQLLLQRIIDHTPAAVFVKTIEGQYLLINQAAAALEGYHAHELIGKYDWEIYPTDDLTKLRAHEQRVVETALPLSDEVAFERADGPRIYRYSCFPITDAHNRVYAIGRIATDVTDLRQMSEAYRALVEHALQGFVIYQNNSVVFANKTMANILGYTVEELLEFAPEHILQLIAPDDRAMVRCYYQELQAGRSIPTTTFRVVRKNGQIRWVECAIAHTHYRGRPALQVACIDITERVQSEEELRENERRYRTIIETMHEGVILHRRDGSISEWNHRAKQLLGTTTEFLIGLNPAEPHWQAVHEDGTPFAGINHPSLVALRTGRSCFNQIMGIYRPDQTLTWVLVNAQPIFHDDRSSSPDGAVTTFTDITKLKQTEKALRESEQRFRAVFEQTVVGIVLTDTEGRITSSNIAFQKLSGYTDEELTQRSLASITHPDDSVRESTLYRDMLATGKPSYEMEKRYIRKDGQMIWCRHTFSFVRDEGGTAIFGMVMVQDITEQKSAQEELTRAYHQLAATNEQLGRNRDLLRTLFDGLPDGLVLLDHHGTILITNQAFATIVGNAPDALVNQSWFAVCKTCSPPFPSHLVARTLQDGVARRRRERYEGKDGISRVLDIQTLPIAGPRHLPEQVVVHVADVTEQLNLETLAIQHERLAARSSLAATVAHEINTPLQSITHCLFLAQDMNDPQRDTYLTIARDEIGRIGQIVRQLLDIHRPTSDRPTNFSIGPLIERVLTLTRGTLEKQRITIRKELAPDLPPLWGYADQVTQVLMNLVMNARNAMPNGGTLWVRTMLGSDHSFPGSGWAVVVEVEDTGMGMTPEVQARIFESFFTTVKGGAGLGLTISQKIMQQHGGDILVKSAPGKGSCFQLVFPISRAPQDRREGEQP